MSEYPPQQRPNQTRPGIAPTSQPMQPHTANAGAQPNNNGQSFIFLQQQLTQMLNRMCNVLVQPNDRVEESQAMLRSQMAMHMGHYQDVLDRIEDHLNKARAVLRRDYAKFQNDQKRKQEEEESKQRAPAVPTYRSQPIQASQAQPKTMQEAAPIKQQPAIPALTVDEPPPALTEEIPISQPLATTMSENIEGLPTALDLDSMLKEMTNQPTPTSNSMDIDMPMTIDSPSLSNLLPNLDSYANMPSAGNDDSNKEPIDPKKAPDANEGGLTLTDDIDQLSGDLGNSEFDELFNFDEDGMDFGGDGEGEDGLGFNEDDSENLMDGLMDFSTD